jgi:hypothetical protein
MIVHWPALESRSPPLALTLHHHQQPDEVVQELKIKKLKINFFQKNLNYKKLFERRAGEYTCLTCGCG